MPVPSGWRSFTLKKPLVLSLAADGTGNKPGVRTGFSSTPSLTPLLTADFCTELSLCCTTGAMAGHAAEDGDHMLTALGWQRAGQAAAKAPCRAGQSGCFLGKKKQVILFCELYFCFVAIVYYKISFNMI